PAWPSLESPPVRLSKPAAAALFREAADRTRTPVTGRTPVSARARWSPTLPAPTTTTGRAALSLIGLLPLLFRASGPSNHRRLTSRRVVPRGRFRPQAAFWVDDSA